MISFESSGSFSKTDAFLLSLSKGRLFSSLEKGAREGVSALEKATPVESGLTSSSWGYEIIVSRGAAYIYWTNTNLVDGSPVAIMLQYGHGTGTGGYVSGRDYINPAITPIFDKIAEDVWKAVTSA